MINASFVIPSSFSLSAINYLLLLSKSALPASTCALSELTYFVWSLICVKKNNSQLAFRFFFNEFSLVHWCWRKANTAYWSVSKHVLDPFQTGANSESGTRAAAADLLTEWTTTSSSSWEDNYSKLKCCHFNFKLSIIFVISFQMHSDYNKW